MTDMRGLKKLQEALTARDRYVTREELDEHAEIVGRAILLIQKLTSRALLLTTELDLLCTSARRFVDAVDASDEDSVGVYMMAQIHSSPYTGRQHWEEKAELNIMLDTFEEEEDVPS